MHPAIIIGTVRSLIVDVAMGQIPRSTERISSNNNNMHDQPFITCTAYLNRIFNIYPPMSLPLQITASSVERR